MQTIGVIGLGLLGSALAKRLHKAGYDVVGYDLLAPRCQDWVDVGGRTLASVGEIAAACDTLVLSLPDADVVASVIREIETNLRPGQLVIDTTTGDPAGSVALGHALAQRGVRFLDATIAGSSVEALAGQAVVMAGGEETDFRSARDLLNCFAREVFYLGPWGSGTRMKLVVNLVLGLNRAVLAEGLTLAKALELDVDLTLAILKASPAYSTVMDTKGGKMLAEDFEPQARLSQHLKDVRLMLAAAERTATDLPLSVVHRHLLERAEAAGYGELDNSAIIRAFRVGPVRP